MSSSTRYEEAMRKLKMLESNATAIMKTAVNPKLQFLNVPEMLSCLERMGLTPERLDGLRVIHVTGTKGKGSTCAFTEILLRSLGLKTGFFSSPHLVHDREQIRIDGKSMTEEAFADAIFSVEDRMANVPLINPDFSPTYFKFLIVLAFEFFLQEEVDVAVVEVGVGGETDCTNVFRSPVACGITTLDFDHCAVLGNSLEEIAWIKSGIFKRDAIAIVSNDQELEPMAKFWERAAERKVASLSTAPPFSAYTFPGGCAPRIGLAGEHQKTNLSVALQLARSWLRSQRPQLEQQLWPEEQMEWCPGEAFIVPSVWAEAIARCHWPGRCQSCAEWFRAASTLSESTDEHSRDHAITLIFHCTGDRVPETLMESLKQLPFSRALFCPPGLQREMLPASDADEHTKQAMRCEDAWRKLRPGMDASRVRRFECVLDALGDIEEGENEILVTGSLILVGSVLSALGYKEDAHTH